MGTVGVLCVCSGGLGGWGWGTGCGRDVACDAGGVSGCDEGGGGWGG